MTFSHDGNQFLMSFYGKASAQNVSCFDQFKCSCFVECALQYFIILENLSIDLD